MLWRAFLFLCLFSSLLFRSSAQITNGGLATLKIAAEGGDPSAQTQMATRDSGNAEVWYRKAAVQGYAPAQGKLAYHFLLKSRTSVNHSKEELAKKGEEALAWARLGATQGDTAGQAVLADICLEGKLVKPDLIEAYKWGDLASKGSMLNTATISGGMTRNAAILRMSAADIIEGRKRVAAFVPQELIPIKPSTPKEPTELVLSGLSGPTNRRLAIINDTTFAQGETAVLRINGKEVSVRCLEIGEKNVLLKMGTNATPIELKLKP